MPRTREQLAERAAQELQDGFYVNLGIGIPTLVANYIPAGMTVTLQESPFGVHRVVAPEGVLPYQAQRLEASSPLRPRMRLM